MLILMVLYHTTFKVTGSEMLGQLPNVRQTVTGIRRMPSSWMLLPVALVRNFVSEEHIVFRFLVTTNVVSSLPILATLMMESIRSSETLVITRVIQCNIPKDGILHSHSRENLKSYIALTGWAF
jgi:hypothetical protein